jgi:hypothetical protein
MTDPISEAYQRVGWGQHVTDDELEALRDHATPVADGGDCDWRITVSVYVLVEDLDAPVGDGVTVAAGTYIRIVEDKDERTWQVDSTDGAIAYAEAIEAEYQAASVSEACVECGAQPGEQCRESGCQAEWV